MKIYSYAFMFISGQISEDEEGETGSKVSLNLLNDNHHSGELENS